jgi:hypothetical protein
VAKKRNGIWEKRPAADNFAAAHDYLTLLFSESDSRKLVKRLRLAPTIERTGKDLSGPARPICLTGAIHTLRGI